MFVFGDLFISVATILDYVLGLYKWVVIIAALITWVNPDPYNPIVRFLHAVTEPVFKPIRRIIGYRLGPIDISPVIVIIVIIFLQSFLVRTIIKIGQQFGGG
ncbi:MAG TPA: YggT family protein [Candidatus Sulfobium mesophilum]|uniref:Yggt family protein n=1 Tax=Candidatus Sulfobium mesophilum TaxID=2016548 RepID=A0A2U3QFT4_9BACT|nr:Yggt family protein [Candidatus Sulfobium mesophilum]HSB30330.1 YggT family protein [Candidatus Sulfobium mesophilum]